MPSLVDTLPRSPYVKGNWADLDVPGTVRAALRLLPDTRQVALVLGSSQREVDAWDYVAREVRAAAPGREFIGLTGLTLEELRQRVRALPAVLLLERRRRMGAQRLNAAVLDSLPGSVAILDRSGAVLRANPVPGRLEGLGGLPPGKPWVPGSSWLEPFREAVRVDHGEREAVVALVQDVLAQRSPEGVVEFRGLTPGIWFELRARRLERSEGGAVVSLVDVTPRKRAELEARQARDERAHLERVAAVGELGVSIAHELNQPLAAIRTNAETAQRLLQRMPMDTALLREVLQDIIADDQRAGEVIRHMRALLKKGESQHAPHDFNELVRGWRAWWARMPSCAGPCSRSSCPTSPFPSGETTCSSSRWCST